MNDNFQLLQQNIIGTIINWPAEIDIAAGILTADDFTGKMYKDLFAFIVEQKGADFVAIGRAFGKKYQVADILTWTEAAVVPSFLKRNCLQLKEENRKQEIYRILSTIRKDFEGLSSSDISEMITSKLSYLSTTKTSDPVHAKTLCKEAIRRLEKRKELKGTLTGIPYGWHDLDEITNGLHRGDLVIIAGRPSMGKSAMVTNIAENVSENGGSVILFSLEMGRDQVTDRMFSSIGKVDFGNIRSANFHESDYARIERAGSEMYQYKFAIDDTPAISLHDVKAKCRIIKSREGLDIVIIDYLQLMSMPKKDNRTQAIGEISRGLKQLARELDVTVIALSQLSRGVDARQDKRPTMSDLRDSGEIEQDADVILFPFREAAYCDKCRDKVDDKDHNYTLHQSVAEFIVEKQRNGDRNVKVSVVWRGRFQRFESLKKRGE